MIIIKFKLNFTQKKNIFTVFLGRKILSETLIRFSTPSIIVYCGIYSIGCLICCRI